MDKHLFQILLILILSTIIGLMDKVKFHWELSWFSTITKPTWFARWLNPHQRLIEKAPVWFAWLLTTVFIGLNDFWHFLKFIMLQTIFYLVWISYHESGILVWLLICNAGYGVAFEVVYAGMFNHKISKLKFTLTDTVSEAEKLFPMPKFTSWYLVKYKSRTYAMILVGIILSGVILTILKAELRIMLLVTYTFLSMLILLAVLHTIAWIKMRIIEHKRAKYTSQHPG